MAVVVFDADVLIAFINRDDAHNTQAVERLRQSLASGERRVISAVNYAEILVGPSRTGTVARVDTMLRRFSIEVIAVDSALARAAADLRARTPLKLPDAFVLAIANRERVAGASVRIESFDEQVLKVAVLEGSER